MPLATGRRRELIHDPGRDARREVLCPLAREGQLAGAEPETGRIAQRQGERDLERRARREPRSGEHAGGQHYIDADGRAIALGEGAHHPRHVSAPGGSNALRLVGAVGRDLDRGGLVERPHSHAPFGVRPGCDDAFELDRKREHEALVVVRVIAHEVDASRRAEEPRPRRRLARDPLAQVRQARAQR